MKRYIARYALTCVLVFGGASAAYAADLGTDAGTSVDNQATVGYAVNSINQTDIDSNVDTFLVDRNVNLTVTTAQAAYTDVTPGATGQVLTYTVSNKTNDTIDILLSHTFDTTDPRGGTENFDATGIQIFVEDGTNAGYQAAEDTATFIDDIAEDTSATVYILGDIPISQVDGDISSHNLVAQAADSGSSAAFTAPNVADTQASVDNVFSDAAGSDGSDAVRDGKHSDDESYRVRSAALTVAKTSRVISDPINNTTNPKRIPGAVLEYCILVTNSSSVAGGTDADNVVITDSISGDPVTYVSGSILVDSSSCTAADGTVETDAGGDDGSDFGDTAADTVTSTKATVTANGGTFRLQFRVTVN